MVQPLLNFLTHTITTTLGSLLVGWYARRYYMFWRYGPPKDSIEIVRESLMYKVATERAITKLTDNEKRELEKEVTEVMKQEYGDNASFEIRDIDNE